MKISVFKILKNKFKIKNLSKRLHPNLCVPINQFFKDLNLNYGVDPSSSSVHRNNNWFTHVILFILVSNILRNLVYSFLNSNDRLFRLFCGDLMQFIVNEVS